MKLIFHRDETNVPSWWEICLITMKTLSIQNSKDWRTITSILFPSLFLSALYLWPINHQNKYHHCHRSVQCRKLVWHRRIRPFHRTTGASNDYVCEWILSGQNDVCLCQEQVRENSNEITDITRLLKVLDKLLNWAGGHRINIKPHLKTDRTTKEKRYYITSLTLDAECIVEDIRTHWSVKNDLHWQLDITFQ